MDLTIVELRALEILDSRGVPTVEVEAALACGARGAAQAPSGASTGRHEAVELRDGDAARYAGKGTRRACQSVDGEIAAAAVGMNGAAQSELDARLIELDGTPDKSRLGANAILGVSCAVARAVSAARGEPLWKTLSAAAGADLSPRLPVPMVNILSGGLHAGRQMEVQDFLAAAHGFPSYAEALRAIADIHRAAKSLLDERGCVLTGVADEGGWGPVLGSNEEALEVLSRAIERAGYRPLEQVSIAIDAAASHFYGGGRYELKSEGRSLRAEELIALYEKWSGLYPVRSLEDGLEQDDWAGWQELTARLGGKMQLVGDDFFTTNPARVERGVRERAANAVLVKMNQIGTLTETFRVLKMARDAGWQAVVSARSGETEDAFLADLACASGAGQIKVGSVTRSERLAKYNRLLRLERDGELSWRASASYPW
jgi:enolase